VQWINDYVSQISAGKRTFGSEGLPNRNHLSLRQTRRKNIQMRETVKSSNWLEFAIQNRKRYEGTAKTGDPPWRSRRANDCRSGDAAACRVLRQGSEAEFWGRVVSCLTLNHSTQILELILLLPVFARFFLMQITSEASLWFQTRRILFFKLIGLPQMHLLAITSIRATLAYWPVINPSCVCDWSYRLGSGTKFSVLADHRIEPTDRLVLYTQAIGGLRISS
jgi:hypothetical protein